jgi:TPR repeat protein
MTFAQGLQAFEAQNYGQALTWLLPVAQSGHPEAQCIIGNIYDLGLGVESDWGVAAYWYEKSMAGGYGLAANNLATIVAIGYGDIPGDRLAANELLRAAKRLGFAHAPACD